MDIKKLNRKKAYLKEQITKLIAADEDLEDVNKIKARLTICENYKKKLEELKDEYYDVADDEELEDINSCLEELDDQLQILEVSLLTLINKFMNKSVDSKSPQIANKQLINVSVRLPEIPLPLFDGSFDQWNNFKRQFISLIEENSELTSSQKLYYLRAALKGDAKHIETAEDTYESLFKALENRFQNKRIMVDLHIRNIMDLPELKQESTKDLRNLLDVIIKNLRALKSLEYESDKFSDILLLNIIIKKLDKQTQKQYEFTLTSNEVPEFSGFLEFLEKRCQILENLNRNVSQITNRNINNQSTRPKSFMLKAETKSRSCICCNNNYHPLYFCEKFKAMRLTDRLELVTSHKLCRNCLGFHALAKCKSKSNCFICHKSNHHTLLHRHFPESQETKGNRSAQVAVCASELEKKQNPSSLFSGLGRNKSNYNDSKASFQSDGKSAKYVLVNTAVVYIKTVSSKRKPLRAILDSASQANFITEKAAASLGFHRERINMEITGINNYGMNIKSKINAEFSNKEYDHKWKVDLFIVPQITNPTPSIKIDISKLNLPRQLNLADDNFFEPSEVDLLLSAEYFFDFLKTGKIKLNDSLTLQDTCFGYIVSGSIPKQSFNTEADHCLLTNTNLQSLDKPLNALWQIENVKNKQCVSEELDCCNQYFEKTTHFRRDDGRYVVAMPFKPQYSENPGLGNSRELATKRLNTRWNRLERNPTMKSPPLDEVQVPGSVNHLRRENVDRSPQRERNQRRNRRQVRNRQNFSGRWKDVLDFEGKYDFEQANAEFQELEGKLSKIKVAELDEEPKSPPSNTLIDKRREFMRLKYEEKKYYVNPREAIKKMKLRAPAVPTTSTSVTQSKSHTVIQNKEVTPQKTGAISQTYSTGDISTNSVPSLFKDLENDPFKSPKIGDTCDDGFADFTSAFGDAGSVVTLSASGHTQSNATLSSSTAFPSSGSKNSASHKKPAPPPPDRYAALADLDNQLHKQAPSEMPTSISSAIVTSTCSSALWPVAAPAMTAAAYPLVTFYHTASVWAQPRILAFQPVPQQVSISSKHVLPQPVVCGLPNMNNAKPSLPNGNIGTYWPSVSSQPLSGPIQNGQPDAFQSQASFHRCR